MGIPSSISRFADYYRRHGFVKTVGRFAQAVKRSVFASRMVVFYCDLADQRTPPVALRDSLKIVRLRSQAEFRPQDFDAVTGFWNPQLAQKNMKERFGLGASLWLIQSEGQLAGFGWSLQGRTVEPYFFPLGKEDVHLFDFHVFPQFRGQGLNPMLVTHILHNLSAESGGRAFIEAAEWNEAQLSSLRKTPFLLLGRVSSLDFSGRTFVSWAENERVQQPSGERPAEGVAATTVRRREL